jgi:TorA maturation chaperone TorD
MSAPKSTPTRSETCDPAAALAFARMTRLLAVMFSQPVALAKPFCAGSASAPDPSRKRQRPPRNAARAENRSPAAADLRLALPARIRDEALDAARVLGLDQRPLNTVFRHLREPERIADAQRRLFGPTVRGLCPPYELEYSNREVFQQTQALADIAGFYAAFGLESSGPLMERPDHVVAELEFLSLVAWHEARAADAEVAATIRNARREFLREHAAAWMPAFFARLEREETGGFFGCIAALGREVLSRCCDELNVRLGPEWIELRPVEPDDVSISCGTTETPTVELGPILAGALDARR